MSPEPIGKIHMQRVSNISLQKEIKKLKENAIISPTKKEASA